jgi:hypothetical protein
MAINHAAYGGYLQSGYGAIGEEFHRNLVAGTLRFCAIWMPIAVGPIVVLTPLVLLALAKRTRVALALLAWVVVYVAFYLPYRWTHEDWWFLRFLLPAVPAFILSGLIGLETMNATTLASPRGRPLAIILIVMFVCSAKFSVYQIERFHALSIGRGEEKYGRIGDWLKANVPEDAALIAMQYSGSDYYFSHYVVIRADELTPQISERVRSAARAAKRGVYAVTFPLERKYIATLPGKWTQIGSVDDVGIWSNDWNAPGS